MGKYVYDKRLTRKTCLTIDTDAGPRVLELRVRGGQVEQVTVDMGIPALSPSVSVEAEGDTYTVWPVDVGNPTGGVLSRAEEVPWSGWGPFWRRAGPSPADQCGVRGGPDSGAAGRPVWGAGSGVTLACGTGACAALAAAVKTGRCGRRAAARLPGGVLELDWDRDSGHIWMTGPAVTVFEG